MLKNSKGMGQVYKGIMCQEIKVTIKVKGKNWGSQSTAS
jgi:hypothetical protein